MKKYLLILLVAVLSVSCLREEADKFDQNASARAEEAVQNAKKVLMSAENGWKIYYFPEETQAYGGYLLAAKFNQDYTVEMASELKNSDYRETSKFSFTKENGPVISFDTYNSCIHFFTDPSEGAYNHKYGTGNGGLLGDHDFIIISAEPDHVVLKGNKTRNKIHLYPAEADWTKMFDDYKADVESMYFPGYQGVYGEDIMSIAYVETYQNFSSRVFKITNKTRVKILDKGTVKDTVEKRSVDASFIFTNNGILFYEPVEIVTFEDLTGDTKAGDSNKKETISFSELIFDGDYTFSDKAGSQFKIVGPTPVNSENKISMEVTGQSVSSVSVAVNTSNADTYYLDYMLKEDYESYADAADLKKTLLKALNNEAKTTSPAEVLGKYAITGNKTISMVDMKMETEYVAVAMGLAESTGCIVASTDIVVKPFATTGLPDNATANYRYWVGTWAVTSASSEVTGTPKTFTIRIWPRAVNSTYFMSGFGIQTVKDLDGYEVGLELQSNGRVRSWHWNCTDKVKGTNTYNSIQSRMRFTTLSTGAYSYYSSSANYAIEYTKTDDTNATAAGRKTTTIQVNSTFHQTINASGSASTYTAIASECAYNTTSYSDYPLGPYTLVKLSDDIRYVVPTKAAEEVKSDVLPLPHKLQVHRNLTEADMVEIAD